MTFKPTLKELQAQQGNPAVSIFIKTHRTFPDNDTDPIALKNALSTTHELIEKRHDKHVAHEMIDLIEEKLKGWDHNYNLDTLAIYATRDHVETLKLPFETKPRIVVSDKFAIRDLLADKHHVQHFLAIVITSEMGRLFECKNTSVVREFSGEDVEKEASTVDFWFPMKNTDLHASSAAERASASNEDDYLREFLNRCDKALQTVNGRLPEQLPIVVIGDRRNIAFYEEVCDTPDKIIGHVDNVENLDGSPSEIMAQCQALVDKLQSDRNTEIRQQIEIAKSNQLLATNEEEIYRELFAGNVQTLIVDADHYASGLVDQGQQRFAYSDDTANAHYYDDAIEELIRLAHQNGGQVAFLDDGVLDDIKHICLIKRY